MLNVLEARIQVFGTKIDRSQSLIGVVDACATLIYRQKAPGVDFAGRTAPYGTLSGCTVGIIPSV